MSNKLTADTPITEAGLSVRAKKALIRVIGYHKTLKDASGVTPDKLLEGKNVGDITVQEIREKLALVGLKMPRDVGLSPQRRRHRSHQLLWLAEQVGITDGQLFLNDWALAEEINTKIKELRNASAGQPGPG